MAQPFVPKVGVQAARLSTDMLRASGTGEVKARVESDLSFRIGGRVVATNVSVGDRVVAGQVLAVLDATQQNADLKSQQAAVVAQEALLRLATSTFNRRKTLTKSGVVPLKELDSALQEYQSAIGDLDAAKARLASAMDVLAQTQLKADADGVITARNVEVGQVVQASATVFKLAHDGDRDGVFNIPEAAMNGIPPSAIEVRLLSDPSVRAAASVREISPVMNRSLGTVRVKIAIKDPPQAMALGSTIFAVADLKEQKRITVPWQAIFKMAGTPSVWTIDPANKTAHLKPLKVERYDTARVVVTSGLEPGELIVIEGGQFLREQQHVSYTERPDL